MKSCFCGVTGWMAAGLVLSALWGCSGGGPEPTYRVTGTVKLTDGTPLADGRVLFRPTGEATHPAKAVIAADGSFQLGTFDTDDGAIAGKHKVMVTPAVSDDMMEDASLRKGQLQIDSSYQSLRTTPLEFTVAENNKDNHFDIEVQPPSRR